jgi:hypothetical protein
MALAYGLFKGYYWPSRHLGKLSVPGACWNALSLTYRALTEKVNP